MVDTKTGKQGFVARTTCEGGVKGRNFLRERRREKGSVTNSGTGKTALILPMTFRPVRPKYTVPQRFSGERGLTKKQRKLKHTKIKVIPA